MYDNRTLQEVAEQILHAFIVHESTGESFEEIIYLHRIANDIRAAIPPVTVERIEAQAALTLSRRRE